ncbi:MAG: hypothetical protein MUC96_09060, partial [Myxococcaceae bacterium]|nr:hypothetical protein [Myxococcaceae bacterium]
MTSQTSGGLRLLTAHAIPVAVPTQEGPTAGFNETGAGGTGNQPCPDENGAPVTLTTRSVTSTPLDT